MTDANIRTQLEARGILLATLDMPGRTMNVFSAGLMDSLEALLDRVEAEADIRGVVLTSGKPAFIAGADLDMIRMFAERARDGTTEELNTLFGRLGRIFRRLELSSKPYVAAINGLALGGGLELAMACHYRIASRDPEAVQLGLPEIKLGLLPGAGGTQRLPRLVGTAKGLEMLLSGQSVTPQQALQSGLVHELAESARLLDVACERAASTIPAAAWDRRGFSKSEAPLDFEDSGRAFDAIAELVGVTHEQRQHYPAYAAIMDCVVGGWKLPMTAACEREMEIFVELMRDPVAGNMVRGLFLNRQRAAKAGLLKADSPYNSGSDALIPRVTAAKRAAEALGLKSDDVQLATALAALQVWHDGKAGETDLADAAILNAGLLPPYTGGPYTWLRQRGSAFIRDRAQVLTPVHAELFHVCATLDRFETS